MLLLCYFIPLKEQFQSQLVFELDLLTLSLFPVQLHIHQILIASYVIPLNFLSLPTHSSMLSLFLFRFPDTFFLRPPNLLSVSSFSFRHLIFLLFTGSYRFSFSIANFATIFFISFHLFFRWVFFTKY